MCLFECLGLSHPLASPAHYCSISRSLRRTTDQCVGQYCAGDAKGQPRPTIVILTTLYFLLIEIAATFTEQYKIRTKADVYQVAGQPYYFLCNEPREGRYKGGLMYVGIDDDSKNFADACSYKFLGMDEKEALAELRKFPASRDGEGSSCLLLPTATLLHTREHLSNIFATQVHAFVVQNYFCS